MTVIWIIKVILGIFLTFFSFKIGVFLNIRTGLRIMNPLVIAIVFVITTLTLLGISYDTYNMGGKMITFFVKPATVALAIPLYKQYDTIKKNVVSIMLGCLFGVIIAISSLILISNLLDIPEIIIVSILSKSITTPMGIEVTNQLGGLIPFTIAAIIATGITGVFLAPDILKLLRVENPTAVGIAIGTSAHVGGTSRAIELGEEQGAMSAVAIPIAGIYTIFLAPLIFNLLMY